MRSLVILAILGGAASADAPRKLTGYERGQQIPAVQQPPTKADASGNVQIPNVFGMTRAEAEATFRRYGFQRFDLDTAICGSTVDGKIIEKGHVCAQSPHAGQTSSPRLTVSLRVQHEDPYGGPLSGERRWFLMPDMIGWDVEVAKARLRELGFAKDVNIATSTKCAKNTVCSTFPDPLTRTDNTSDKLIYVGG